MGVVVPTVKRKERPPTDWTPPTAEPLFAFGTHPFAPRRDSIPPEGVRVGGIRVIQAPDGSLVGIVDGKPIKEEPTE